MAVLTGDTTFFPFIDEVRYEGRSSDNPLAYKYYEADRKVGERTMAEHFRFAIAWWHSFGGSGADPFGPGTQRFPWDTAATPELRARDKVDAAFEFITKMGVDYYCFHDYDLVEEADTLAASEQRLQGVVDYLKEKQAASGVQLLWGTANLFSHPRYMNGAATNPDFKVVAHAGFQVKNAIDATIALGGQNYVFWGGREGYMSLLNTDMGRELDHLAKFLHAAKDYARANGFTGNFLIEPKPMEPMKHQYDFDSATCLNFLRQYDLLDDFKLNLEFNHATLAGHTMQHEMQVAADAGALGSLDANRGDYQNGWDTDQFPVDLYELTECMLVFLEAGGLQGGGINFDAKLRRNSTDAEDLFIAHIGGMDAFARSLTVAHDILTQSDYQARRQNRYASFDTGDGKAFEDGKWGLEDLRNLALQYGEPARISGKQELLENLINQYI